MRTPKLLLLGIMLSFAAPTVAAQASTGPGAPKASRVPKAPRAPRAPRAPVAPEPPLLPEPPLPPEPPSPPEPPAAFVHRGLRPSAPSARLGTQVSAMTGELRAFFGAPEDAGLLVQHLEPGSAAEAAKVKVGDVLVEVAGRRIAHPSDVRDALAGRRAGDRVDVVVIRKHQRKALEVTLTAASTPAPVTALALEHGGPPHGWPFVDAPSRSSLEHDLEQVREQLRRVEQQLDALRGAAAPEPPAPPAAPPPPGEAKRRKRRTTG